MIIGIDPGTRDSGYVKMRHNGKIADADVYENGVLLSILKAANSPIYRDHIVAIEMVENQGRSHVGRETFETCVWIGRFDEGSSHATKKLIGRRDVKLLICGTARANDADIRRALLDLYGGKQTAVGRKAQPGPLYGVKSHAWQALAVAVAAMLQIDPMWRPR
jgi:hypothetical protein